MPFMYWAILLLFFNSIQHILSVQHQSNAGIYFRINQKAVDYITDLASDAMPQILNNMHLPNVSISSATISKFHLNRVERPTINAKFIRDRGVRANVSLPFLRTTADCSVESFLPLDGSVVVELHNFTIALVLHIGRNESSGENIIEVPHCETTHSNVVILLEEDSLLSLFSGMLESTISDAVRVKICEVILDAVKFVDAQSLQATDNFPSTTTPSSAKFHFNPAEFGASLCEIEQIQHATTADVRKPDSASNSTKSGAWSANLKVVYPPKFSDEDVVFGIDGGLLFNGVPAKDVHHPTDLNISVIQEKMIGILLTDTVANTFFSHIFANEMGTVHERFEHHHLPRPLRKIANMMCSKCFLDITANLTEQPRAEISAKMGIRLEIAGNILIQFQGRDDLHNLIYATTKLHVTLKPTIRHSQLYGDVALTQVDVKVFDLGIGGVLSKPIEKLVSFIVPRVLWPQVKNRIRFALNRRGIQLPVLCGVTFEQMSLSYIDHAAVVNTDFTFDLPLFVEKFKLYLIKKAEIFNSMPTYVEV